MAGNCVSLEVNNVEVLGKVKALEVPGPCYFNYRSLAETFPTPFMGFQRDEIPLAGVRGRSPWGFMFLFAGVWGQGPQGLMFLFAGVRGRSPGVFVFWRCRRF